jgi:hypothetical protein
MSRGSCASGGRLSTAPWSSRRQGSAPAARGRPDSDAITPEGDPDRVSARPLEKDCAGGALSRDRPFRRAEALGRRLLRRLGVSPFTVGRSPSARCKTAGSRPAPSGAREALRRVLSSRNGERRDLAAIGGRSAISTGRGVSLGRPSSRAHARRIGFKTRIYVK